MTDEATQVSAEPAEVADNPSLSLDESAEKGSPDAAPAQEHREPDLAATLAKLDPKTRKEILAKLDPSDLLDLPGVKSYAARHAKSMADKAADSVRKQVLAERERERLKAMDPYELGSELQKRLAAEEEVNPLYEKARRDVGEQAYNAGYQAAYQEVSSALDDLPHWKGMDQAERQQFIHAQPQFSKFLASVLNEGVTRQTKAALNKQLATAQGRQEREDEVEARATERTPTLGGSSAAQSDAAFLAAYAEGRTSDHARARKLLEG